MHYLDHVILGVSDLAEGIGQFESLTGVRPIKGGEHPGLGTHNALVSLGERTYLEILAPRPNAEVVDWLKFLHDIPQIKPVMWVIGSDDIHETADVVAGAGFEMTPPVPGSRQQIDGSTLRWHMFNPIDPDFARLFFFIEWNRASVHPAASSPDGCEITSLQIADSTAPRLQGLFDTLGLMMIVSEAGRSSITLQMRCPKGLVGL